MPIYNKYPPEKAGDAALSRGEIYDMKLLSDNSHEKVHAGALAAFTLLGIAAAHDISAPRIESEIIDAHPEGTVDIVKPLVDQIAEVARKKLAIQFARGVLHALKIDFPELRDRDEIKTHELFQELISGVSEEVAQAIERRRSAQ